MSFGRMLFDQTPIDRMKHLAECRVTECHLAVCYLADIQMAETCLAELQMAETRLGECKNSRVMVWFRSFSHSAIQFSYLTFGQPVTAALLFGYSAFEKKTCLAQRPI